MGFDTIIVNGRIVDSNRHELSGHVALADGKIALIGKDLPRDNATRSSMQEENTFFRAESTSIPIWTCRSAVRPARTTLRPGHALQPLVARPRLPSISLSNTRGKPYAPHSILGCKKLQNKAVCDYSFHCIITDLAGAQLDEMNALVREGVSSFSYFMAYPGVFMLDDADIFKALRATLKNGAIICMHAENGGAIDVIVQQALAEGKRAPNVHALTRPTSRSRS